MKFFLYLGVVVVAVSLFFSGSLPYTLIYDQESLQGVEHTGDEPITEEVIECDIDGSRSLGPGATFKTTFNVRLRNNTNRYVAMSLTGEVFDSGGSPISNDARMVVLSPNSAEELAYTLNSTFTVSGRYTCELRYTIAR
ncbi:MAG: hypothetical protein AAFN50_15100 [Pseudomonadota bacterium]